MLKTGIPGPHGEE